MPKTSRTRIDYMPGKAALEALEIASERFPRDRTQALIDRLVICGVSALEHPPWRPPALYGRDRDTWALPDNLKPEQSL